MNMEWIKVSERLPKEDEHVLFCVRFKDKNYSSNWVICGHYDCYYKDWVSDDDELRYGKDKGETVTHWMPLPEPPKEDEVE